MEISTRTIGRSRRSHAAGSFEIGDGRLTIRLPDLLLMRLVARSVFVVAAVLAFPWFRARYHAASGLGGSPAPVDGGSRWIDQPFHLPMLLRDLKRQGLLKNGDRAVFLGDPGARMSVLRRTHVDHVPDRLKPAVPDRSVDLVLAADGLSGADLKFVNRVLRVGGIAVVRLGSGRSSPARLPPNYKMVYIRRFGSTIMATKNNARAADE